MTMKKMKTADIKINPRKDIQIKWVSNAKLEVIPHANIAEENWGFYTGEVDVDYGDFSTVRVIRHDPKLKLAMLRLMDEDKVYALEVPTYWFEVVEKSSK